MSETSINVALTGDPSSGQAAVDAMKKAGEDYMEAIVRQSAQVVRSLDTVVGKLDDLGKKHAETAESTANMGSEVAGHLAKVAAEVFTVEKAWEGLKDVIGETIMTADQLRDLQASLGALSSSPQAGAAAWKFFDEEQKHSRDTAQELAAMYRDVLPVAMKRFGEEGTREITMMLSQMAPLAGQTAQAMDDAFKQLLMGRVRGTNPLLVMLGMTKEEFKEAGGFSDEMIQHMRRLAGAGEDLGQTFESTAHKIKSEWFDAMADGFNDQRKGADDALSAIKASLTDPEVIQGFHNLGGMVAGLASGFGTLNTVLNNFDHNLRLAVPDLAAFERIAAAALAGAAVGGPLGPAGMIIGGTTGALIQGWGNAAANAEAPSADPSIQRLRDIRAGKFGGAAETGVTSIVGSGEEGLAEFYRSLGEFKRTHAPEFKEALQSIRDEVDHGAISLANYKSSLQSVLHKDGPHDNQKKGLDDTTAADTKAMQEQIRLIGEIAHLDDQRLGMNEKLAIAAANGNKYAIDGLKVEFEYAKQLTDLTAKRDETQLKLQDDIDRGDAAARSADQGRLDAINQAIAGLDGYRIAQLDILGSNFWETLDLKEAAALTKADDNLDQFVSKSRDKLAAMPTQVAESVSRSLRENRLAMDMALGGVFAGVGEGGTFDAEAARKIEATYRQNDEEILRAGEQTAKLLTDNIVHAEHRFAQQFSSDFASIIESGGHNFAQIIAGGFKQTVDDSVATISRYLVGSPGDPHKAAINYMADGTPYLTNQQIGQMYDPQGNNITDRSAAARGALDVAQIGFSGYQAGQSGTPGARTGATLSGGIAGASIGAEIGSVYPVIGTVVGAVAGALVGIVAGAVGGYLGAQAKREDYKYGIPTVDTSGVAHFGDTQNYGRDKNTPAGTYTPQEMAVVRQIQGIYDSIHDSLAMILIKAGDLVPVVQGIGGKIQDNPSGHFEEHLGLFESGKLQSDLMDQFKGELTGLAVTVGMSADRFKEIWGFLQNVDPTKAVGLLGTMFGALGGPNSSLNSGTPAYMDDKGVVHPGTQASEQYQMQHYDNAMIGFNPSAAMMGMLDQRSQMNPGQIIHEMDAEILNLANGLKGMSPEGQINAIAQIDSLNKQRYQAELQMVQQLLNVVKQIDAQTESSVKNFEAQKILKDDGTADQFGLSQFYKKNADKDLRDIQNAKNADQLSTAWQKYQQDVQQAEQFGYAQDPTKAGKQAWAQWGIDNEKLGQGIADQIAASIGMSLNPEQAAFNAKFDPLIDLFKNGITKMFNPGDGSGDGDGGDKNPITRENALLANSASATATSFNNLTPNVDTVSFKFSRLAQALDAFEDRISSVLSAGSRGGSADEISGFVNWELSNRGFINRTIASRG